MSVHQSALLFFQYLDRGLSIFKGSWEIEDEVIRSNLCISSHMAFLHVALEFANDYAEKHELAGKAEVMQELADEVCAIEIARLHYRRVCN